MGNLDRFYDVSPTGVIDQNQWDDRIAEVDLRFRQQSLYTPLVEWDSVFQQHNGAQVIEHELMEGDVDFNEIPLTANYVDASFGIDSRFRKFAVARYGDKVQMHKSNNLYHQWKISGGSDWRPLLRGVLGSNVLRKHEALSRNVWFKGPKNFWTYAGTNNASWADLSTSDKIDLAIVNEWNLRLGQTGSPLIPGTAASAKLAIVPPGAVYDLMKALPAASGNETALWRDAQIYAGQGLFNYEIGSYKNVRFLQAPNDQFGVNPNVLYNCGAITKQYGVTEPIRAGDGAPDPETTAVDDVWYVGQKNVTHFIKLEDFTNGDFVAGDWVTIHVKTTAAYGVTGGVDPFDGRTIVRRVVAADATANTLAFDRPISFNYTAAFSGKSVTGNTLTTLYAYVTKGVNIGFSLVLGSRGGVRGRVMEPVQFYEPDPIDDFKSVWRFTWDAQLGWNIADPHQFELHFFAVSLPKPGGVG